MGEAICGGDIDASLPCWVPEPAKLYLRHIETGAPIRALARETGCHASTVLRRIRSYEALRDDLLVDQALRRLGAGLVKAVPTGSPAKETVMIRPSQPVETTLSDERLEREAPRLLRRLCERKALMAVAMHMEKAVVVRETEAGTQTRTAVTDRDVAEAMALKGWISCDAPGQVSRYYITGAGRAALGNILARAESAALTDSPEARPEREPSLAPYETPLAALSRRRNKEGGPFLSPGLVRVGERLREDFELAQMGAGGAAPDWGQCLESAESGRGRLGEPRGRVEAALRDLGPGLGDIALSCCCHLEGLESAERRMGWSARSGKIVLRIALQRLKRFYDRLGDEAAMIG
ncbi:DUF6456 domain-containing protein [Roseovarius sp. C7]|uniref:DUF6456 domain-containing protein n=1 Tax=Roseovarius sp. C7 TaxID=3398643 RepID=UPI0039F5B694